MRAIKTFLFFGRFAILICVSTFAIADEGSHTAAFLDHGVGARALAFGSPFVSIADDATATYWNPAGLTQISRHAFASMFSDTFRSGEGGFLSRGLVQYSFVNYVHRIEDLGTIGLSWIRLGIDDIPRTTFIDVNGNGILGDFQDKNGNGVKDPGELYIDRPTVAEYFGNNDNAIFISYAHQLRHKISIGGNLKLIYQSLFENSGFGFGFDLGVIVTPIKNLRFGGVLTDATKTQIRWNTVTTPTFTRDRKWRLGISYLIDQIPFAKFLIGFGLETDRNDLDKTDQTAFEFGSETWLFDHVAIRFRTDRVRQTNLGAGLRLKIREIDFFVDYAFGKHDLGNSQRVSISGKF